MSVAPGARVLGMTDKNKPAPAGWKWAQTDDGRRILMPERSFLEGQEPKPPEGWELTRREGWSYFETLEEGGEVELGFVVEEQRGQRGQCNLCSWIGDHFAIPEEAFEQIRAHARKAHIVED